MRSRFVWLPVNGVTEVPADYVPRPRRFHIGTDTREPFKSHADGKYYSSQSRYAAEYKARGFEELGNEKAAFFAPPERPKTDYAPELYRALSEQGVSD